MSSTFLFCPEKTCTREASHSLLCGLRIARYSNLGICVFNLCSMQDTVDYIFCSMTTLIPRRVLAIPPEFAFADIDPRAPLEVWKGLVFEIYGCHNSIFSDGRSVRYQTSWV